MFARSSTLPVDERGSTRERILRAAPSGLADWLLIMAVVVPLWAVAGLWLVPTFVKGLLSRDRVRSAATPGVQEDLQPPVGTWTHEFIHANGVTLHAVSAKRNPRKSLMLFLHGWPENWYSWHHALDHFKHDYDAVALDMRGFGHSDKPQHRSAYSLDILAADIREAIRVLGHSQCVLVGHDWGGVVAWVLAALTPQVVTAMVVVAAPHALLMSVNMTTDQRLRSAYVGLMQVPVLAEAVLTANGAHLVRRMQTPGTRLGPLSDACVSSADAEWYARSMLRPGNARGGLNYYRSLVDCLTHRPVAAVWRAWKEQVRVPVMVLWGERDPALGPGVIHGVEAVAPGAVVHWLPCSHWVQRDRPDEVHGLIREFLACQPPASVTA